MERIQLCEKKIMHVPVIPFQTNKCTCDNKNGLNHKKEGREGGSHFQCQEVRGTGTKKVGGGG